MQLFRHQDESLPPPEPDQLPVEPPAAHEGMRNLWDQHDYLLTMIPRLADFGIPILDAIGLTLNETIYAEKPIPGCGIREGEEVIAVGTVVTPRIVALLCEMGIDKVIARPAPRVVVIALSPQAATSSFSIAAESRVAGAQAHRVTSLATSDDAMVDAISEQLVRSDLVVTVGGLGENGLDMRRVAEQIGAHDFTPVAVSPGREQGFALAGDERVPMVALPADPGAAFVLTKLLIAPMIRHMMGVKDDTMRLVRAELAQSVKVTPGLVTCVPGNVDDDKITIGGRFTGIDGLYRAYRSNALVVLEADSGLAEFQSETWYLPL